MTDVRPLPSCRCGTRTPTAAILVLSVGALVAAFVAQYGFGLTPCILCIVQRIPYAVAAVLAALALITVRSPHLARLCVQACAVVFIVGIGIAIYHVGVEEHWWEAVTSCTGEAPANLSLAETLARAQSEPVKPCDQVDWRLFGIFSMAGLNVFAFAAMAALSIVASRSLKKAGALT